MLLPSAFVGGRLKFTWLNMEFDLKLGDVLIFKSWKILHVLTEIVDGLRQSIVLTSPKCVMEKIKAGIFPDFK